jgi:type III pantothenate kinase
MSSRVLAVDIGNSNIGFGLFANGRLVLSSRIATDRKKTADDYGVSMMGIFALKGKSRLDLDGAVMSSVVPCVSDAVATVVESIGGVKPLRVSADNCGLDILVDSPGQVGTDRIANTVAAVDKYSKPVIIFDLGTATTVSVVNEEGAFIGGSIHPGVTTSLEALSSVAAQLPPIEIQSPGPVIARNTVDCMCGGIIYGTAAMLDGMAERIEEALGKTASIVVTGGLASGIVGHCKKRVIYHPDLLMEGLYLIYTLNAGKVLKDGKGE